MTKTDITAYNVGNQLYLGDGGVWRVAAAMRDWKVGEVVTVEEWQIGIWTHRICNIGRDQTVLAMNSSTLDG